MRRVVKLAEWLADCDIQIFDCHSILPYWLYSPRRTSGKALSSFVRFCHNSCNFYFMTIVTSSVVPSE